MTLPDQTRAEGSLIAYKAFDENMQCRGYQYAVGETYTHDGRVEMCSSGFHACENPLDVLYYYPLVGSRFAIVEYAGEVERKADGDSKVCGATLTVKAEVKFGSLIEKAVGYIISRAKKATSGDRSHAATSGDYSPAATSGDRSPAATKGKNSVAASIGYGARARAGKTGGIALAEYDYEGNLVAMFASLVGQNGIEPDTWYRLKNGEPVKC